MLLIAHHTKGRHVHRSSYSAAAFLRYLCLPFVIAGLVFHHIIAGIADQLAAVVKKEKPLVSASTTATVSTPSPFILQICSTLCLTSSCCVICFSMAVARSLTCPS